MLRASEQTVVLALGTADPSSLCLASGAELLLLPDPRHCKEPRKTSTGPDTQIPLKNIYMLTSIKVLIVFVAILLPFHDF